MTRASFHAQMTLSSMGCPRRIQSQTEGRTITRVGCHALLQQTFLTQGSNPRFLRLLHEQSGSLPLVSLEKPMAPCRFVKELHFTTGVFGAFSVKNIIDQLEQDLMGERSHMDSLTNR